MKHDNFALGLTMVASAASACAMSSPSADGLSCTVINAEKLPAELGGADGLCDTIRAAAGANVGGLVVVRVKNASGITATITDRGGRTHPEFGLSVSDATLSRQSVERFAAEVARALSNSI